MKKMIMRSLFVGTCVLFWSACGGSGGKSISDAIDNATSESDSEKAFESSEWSNKTPVEPDQGQAVAASGAVQGAVSTVVAGATTGVTFSKSAKSEANIDHTVNGSVGGTAKVTGKYTYATGGQAIYPIDYTYDFKISFNNYKDPNVAINGQITYKGEMKMTSQSNFTTKMSIKGGYSVLHGDTAYNIVTDLDVTLATTGSGYSVTYKYTVNGKTYSGSY